MSVSVAVGSASDDPTSVARRLVRSLRPRPTAWVPAPTHLSGVLDNLPARRGWSRVFLVGRSWSSLDGLRQWAARLPHGWVPAEGGHYLDGSHTWVLRYRHESGRCAEVRPASEWFGRGSFTAADASEAWVLLHDLVAERWAGRPALLSSPAATGRDLWVRQLSASEEWPAPPPDVADMIRAGSGQGRSEVVELEGRDSLPWLVEMDGRLMYLALMRELPGRFVDVVEGHPETFDPYERARYLVEVTVPAGWAHVGLVGRRADAGRWEYPRVPGETWETWCDGVELQLLENRGWPFVVRRRIVFQRGRPLDRWAARMLGAIGTAPSMLRYSPRAREMAAGALRLVAISALGGFQGRPFLVDRSAPLHEGPPGAGARNVRVAEGRYHWQEPTPPREPWSVQPHWPASVWARSRVRLLTHRGRAGALHVPLSTVVAMRTDALYLTVDPTEAWESDGRPGVLRRKWWRAGPMPAPTSVRELLALKGED